MADPRSRRWASSTKTNSGRPWASSTIARAYRPSSILRSSRPVSTSPRSGGSNDGSKDASAPKGNPCAALLALARRRAIPCCSAHSTPLSANVVLPTPAGPAITAPRLAATAPVNWESSLCRPTIGHPGTLEGSSAGSLPQRVHQHPRASGFGHSMPAGV
jgi:hypothetical protein